MMVVRVCRLRPEIRVLFVPREEDIRVFRARIHEPAFRYREHRPPRDSPRARMTRARARSGMEAEGCGNRMRRSEVLRFVRSGDSAEEIHRHVPRMREHDTPARPKGPGVREMLPWNVRPGVRVRIPAGRLKLFGNPGKGIQCEHTHNHFENAEILQGMLEGSLSENPGIRAFPRENTT